MDLSLILSLTGLALLDSTSIGTLFIPVWLLLAPGGVKPMRILLYLATIALFYLLVGIVLMLGAAPLLGALGQFTDHPVLVWGQLLLGVVLIVVSFRFDSKRSRRLGKPDRAARWRERASGENVSARFLMTIALLAALAEVATMLPYLAGIAILSTSELAAPAVVGLLAAYCLVMVVPALLLLTLLKVSQRLVEPVLIKLDAWISRHGETTVGWIIGIAGFLVARDALAKLSLPFLSG
ncbi:MAG: GAP family protein [Pseudohongiella sp.]|uniref:GAP family protein n=1 Tax=Pseudohongiella sp. TaxID=1979412 RepID=UPI0034A069FF